MLMLVGCQSGLTDAERVWCVDNTNAVVAAALHLDLYQAMELPKPTPWTYQDFLKAVSAGRVDWIYRFSDESGYLSRLKSGEVLSLQVGSDSAAGVETFDAQVRAALRNGGHAEDSITRLDTLTQPLTDANRERACKAAFEAR